MSVVVSDTSPIRALAHLGHIDLLPALFREVYVPPAVVAELEQPRPRFAALDIGSWTFLKVRSPMDGTAVEHLLVSLGRGEAEAIVLATEVHADAILMDEAAGRLIARQRGLQPLGVLGILLRAKWKGLVPAISPLLDRLRNELGFHISEELRAAVVREARE